MSALLLLTAAAQTPAPKVDRVIGDITKVDGGAKQLTVKPAGGAEITATVSDRTIYLRISPGETDIKKAARIAFDSVAVGDRARFRGHLSEDQKSMVALEVLIMSKAEIAQKQQHDREEWKRRSVSGPVTAVNPDSKEITITTRTREGSTPLVIEAGNHVEFLRYAPDSIRFSDAKPSAFADVKVGDQVRVLGDKNADGTRIKAEAMISGSFRNIAGVIKSIDASTNEITMTDLVAHKPVTVRVTADTTMRRLPQGVAMMLARRVHGAQGGSDSGAAGAQPTTAQGVPGPARPDAPKPGAGAPPTDQAQGQGGGTRRGNMDFQDMLEHLPPMTVADLKAGDAVMVSAGDGSDPGRVAAITLLAGVEPLLQAAPQGGRQIFGDWNLDMGGGGQEQ
jgi:Cu/Ag efflux protein CusF